jgi:hypothetical protein
MAVEPTHGSQDIQTVNGQAKEDQYWFQHLEKARLAAYQNLERYIASQEGHVQADETEQLGGYLSMSPSAAYNRTHIQQFRTNWWSDKKAYRLSQLSRTCGRACKILRICSHRCAPLRYICFGLACFWPFCKYLLCCL